MQVGDKVMIHKPETWAGREDSPTWTDMMDQFDGLITTITRTTSYVQCKDTGGYFFGESWLTPIHRKKIPRPNIPTIVIYNGEIREEK